MISANKTCLNYLVPIDHLFQPWKRESTFNIHDSVMQNIWKWCWKLKHCCKMENLRSIYGIHTTLGWIAFMKHRITRKGEEKDEKHIKK